MKTTIKIALAALALSAFAFEGCKKGPDDPFMSIHSRKGRMTGDWTVKSGSGTFGTPGSMTTWTYDGTTYTETDASGSASETYSATYTFDKDGTFKSEVKQSVTGFSDVTTETGTWNFTAGVGDDKKKDHVVMKTLVSTDAQTIGSSTTTTTDTYTGDNAATSIMFLDELKNKEIIFSYDGTTTSGSNPTSTSSGKWTLAQ